jgi:hypothetical protein
MSHIFGYGEDALTYWAITIKLEEILQSLGDKSLPADATVIYRPSFGRRGSVGHDPKTERLSAEFGEFDAILGTKQAIYLVESKWDSSSETRDSFITLKDAQERRHKIMRWYIETWRVRRPNYWMEFVAQQETAFQTQFLGNKMAPVNSRLAQNLEFILRRLSECGANVQDVLLFFGQASSSKPLGVKPEYFNLIMLEYQTLLPSGYFQI